MGLLHLEFLRANSMNYFRLFLVILALGIFAITLPYYRSHIFAVHFVDEDDNIVIGNYLREGKKLYTDIFSQHQPSMFVLSAALQDRVFVNNVQMVVQRHRELMIVWSLLWVIFLVARFGFPLLLTTTVIEMSKIALLGNLFLAESIVIYPLIYVLAHYFFAPSIIKTSEKIILSIVFWFLWYSLTPLWPLLILIFLIFGYKHRSDISLLKIYITTAAIFTLLLLIITNFRDYFISALYINYKYYIPLTTPFGFAESIYKSLFAPILAIFSTQTGELLMLIRILSVALIINIAYLIKSKKYMQVVITVILLWLTSLRYIDPAGMLYGVFHMLPWFAVLTLLAFINDATPKLVNIIMMIMVMLAACGVARTNLFDSRIPENDYYINFSPKSDIREAVKILSVSSPQTIWVEPVMYYPHWRTNASPYTKMVNYYGWMDQTEPLKNDLDHNLEINLPTIVYAETKLGIGAYLEKYTPITREGKPSGLYLRADQVDGLSKETRAHLLYYRFEIN